MNDILNKATIQGYEGRRLIAYRDTVGKLTIGYGFNLNAGSAAIFCRKTGVDYDAICAGAAITPAQASAIFELQYAQVAGQAAITFPDIATLPDNAAAVICDMIFQLGWAGFLGFHNTIAAFRAQSWAAVIMGLEDSALAKQTPNRVAENVKLLEAIAS